MSSLSELNKKERELKGEIEKLRRRFRKEEISSRDFDSAFGKYNSELEEISAEKGRLISSPLPPLPPPPAPSRDMVAIRESLEDIPRLPVKALKARVRPKKAPSKPAPKKPPGAAAPSAEPDVARRLEKGLDEMSDIRIDVARHEQESRQFISDLKDIRKQLDSLLEMNHSADSANKGPPSDRLRGIQVDVARHEQQIANLLKEMRDARNRFSSMDEARKDMKELKQRLEKTDFKGLSDEIYSQFDKMNQTIKEADKSHSGMTDKLEAEVSRLSKEVKDLSKLKDVIDKLDAGGMRRDLEMLMQKSQFIEKQLEDFDFTPLMDMVHDVDRKVNNIRHSSALIIE